MARKVRTEQLLEISAALHAELRKVYGPAGTGPIRELQIYCAIAVSAGVLFGTDLEDDDAMGIVTGFGRHVSTLLAATWGQSYEQMAGDYERRYAEYLPMLGELVEQPGLAPRLADALDVHVAGAAMRDQLRTDFITTETLFAIDMVEAMYAVRQ